MTTSFLLSADAPAAEVGGADLRRLFVTVAAALAAAGGVIHFTVVGDHSDYPVVAAGFVAMGASQFLVALWLFKRPSGRTLLAAGALHGAIAATWALSRTVGLGFVPGESGATEIGVADVVANTFSLGVIGMVVVVSALDRAAHPIVLPAAVARRMTGVAIAGALVLSAIAMSAPHVHDAHAPVARIPATGHTHGSEASVPGQH